MTPNQIKYIHVSTTNRAGKWKSINLSNLAKEMPIVEIKQIIPVLTEKLIAIANERVTRLTELEAPPIILDNEIKAFDKVKAGKHADLIILNRTIRQAV